MAAPGEQLLLLDDYSQSYADIDNMRKTNERRENTQSNFAVRNLQWNNS